MKIKLHLAFFIIFALLLSSTGGFFAMATDVKTATPTPEEMKSNGISPITGTFIQPWLYSGWNNARWEQEIAFWKELGIEYIIIGDTLDCTCEPISDPTKWNITAHYPTTNPAFKQGQDVLTNVFEIFSKHDIKLYIGMGNALTSQGWTFLDLNATGFENVCTMFATVAEEIYNNYYEAYPDTFAGFYFVPELYNSSNFDNAATRSRYVSNLSKGFKIIFEKLNSLNPSLPFIFSPYVNMFGGSWVSKSPENIGYFWKELLENAGFRDGDIICPQDSVGAGGNNLEHLGEVTAAYRYAVDNCGRDVQLWSNCEIFIQPPTGKFYDQYDGYNYWSSCSVDRMVSQMQIVSEYVDRIFLFAVPHYLSPYNAVKGYYDAYKFYLENGEMESVPPTPPTKFRTTYSTVKGVKSLTVTWSGMYDNVGIHRVNIYKNGEFFTYRNATRNEGSGIAAYPNSFVDMDYDPEVSVTYEFEVIDCSGNVSARSSFTVEPGSVPNNVRLDRAYNGPVAESSEEENSSAESSEETTIDVSEQISDTSSESKSQDEINKEKSLPGWVVPAAIGALAVAALAVFAIIKRRSRGKSSNNKI